MDSVKNIIHSGTSASFQAPLPLLHKGGTVTVGRPPVLERKVLIPSTAEEAQQSLKIKKSALMHALQAKKNGNSKEFFEVVNKQSFMNAKEDPKALRIWVKVFLESLSKIIHDYNDKELLELLVFKLPWFIPTTTHGQSFNSFLRLVMAVFPYDISYIHKVINHIFSSHGLFQCIMLGERRQVLADLLWCRAQKMMKAEMISDDEKIGTKDTYTEEQITNLNRYFHEIKTLDDITNRAKIILKKNGTGKNENFIALEDTSELLFMRVVFSFHPSRDLPQDPCYPIFVGKCLGHVTFLIKSSLTHNQETQLGEQDAISVKKSVVAIAQTYSLEVKSFSNEKYQHTPLKRVAQLLAKMSELYPSCAQELIVHQLIEKLPHKNTSVDDQYQLYRFAFEVARLCPNSEERILAAIVDKLCQLDVDIKNSKARRKCYTFSSLSKIQAMAPFLKELYLKVPNDREIKMGILIEMLFDYVKEKLSRQEEKNKDVSFVDTLMKIFETKIFPVHKINFMQYLPLYIMAIGKESTDTAIKVKSKEFTEKLISFLIHKSFGKRDHLSERQHAWNYIVSIISRESNIIRPQIIMRSLQESLKFYNQSYCQEEDAIHTTKARSQSIQSSLTETSEAEVYDQSAKTSQKRIFLHCFIQGLAHVLATKHHFLQREDPRTFTDICKLVFKKHFKESMIYCSPIMLSDLLKVTQQKNANSGLSIFRNKVQALFKSQKEAMQSSKRCNYDKISKFFPYDSPYYLYPQNELLLGSLVYEDINSEDYEAVMQPEIIIIDSSSVEEESKIGDSTTSMAEEDSKMKSENEVLKFKHSEIDLTTSGQEDLGNQQLVSTSAADNDIEMKEVQSIRRVQANQSILYEPETAHMNGSATMDESCNANMMVQESESIIDLDPVIARSRETDNLYNINTTLCASAHERESKELYFKVSRNTSMLSQTFLQELETKTQVHDKPVHFEQATSMDQLELASSSKDTEYSVNPGAHNRIVNFSKKEIMVHLKKKTSVEKSRDNITMSLREDNERAALPKRRSARKAAQKHQ